MSWRSGGRVGRQEPRLRSVPGYTETLGNDAIELAAAAGLILDPWQADVVRDILAVRDDGQWASFETCTIAQRQQGKGSIVETIELAGLFLFGERLILHSAHEYKTAQEAFLRIRDLISGCPDLVRLLKGGSVRTGVREANGEQQIMLESGARLRFVARSKGSGRGFTTDRTILDEAYALTRTQLAALLPTMSARPNPQMNQFSTVPDLETMPEPDEAVLPAIRDRALIAALDFGPTRESLAYHDWSMRPGEDPTSVDLWYECNSALGIRISEEYVAAELAALGPAKFSVERLGLWPADADLKWAEVSEQQWSDAADPASTALDPVAFSVDVTPERTRASIAAVGARVDGDLHGVVVDHREGTDWVVARLVDLVGKWSPCAVSLVGTAAAFTLHADLVAGLKAAGSRLEVKVMTNRELSAGFGMTVDALKAAKPARRLRWRTDLFGAELTAAVRGAVKREIGEGSAWDRASSSVDISPLVAMTNAVHTFVSTAVPPPVAVANPQTPQQGSNVFRPTGRLNI